MQRADTIPPGQLRILGRIQTFIAEHRYPPTYRDLALAEGCRVNNIREQIARLRRKGLLAPESESQQARNILPTCRIERIP